MNPLQRYIDNKTRLSGGWGRHDDPDTGWGDDDEDYDLAGIDDEIDQISGEIDDDLENDEGWEPHSIGATTRSLTRKLDKLRARRAKVVDKQMRARSPRRQARLQKRIDKIDRKIDKTEDRMTRKLERQVQRNRISPTAAAAIASGAGLAGAAATFGAMTMARTTTVDAEGLSPSAAPVIPQPGGGKEAAAPPSGAYTGESTAFEYVNFVDRSTPPGKEVPVPMLINGGTVGIVDIAIGAGPAVVPFTAQSFSIPYAGFKITGLKFILNLQPNAEALINVLTSQFGVDGGINLLFGEQSLSFAGQSSGLAAPDNTQTISGMRKHPPLQPTNLISLTGTLRQDAANPTQAIRATLQIIAIGIVTYDPQAWYSER